MAIEKIVVCKKDHKCCHCDKTIKKGESACYMSGREPKYDVELVGGSPHEEQIGINYYRVWFCYDKKIEQWPSCAINN